jgi:hypothetical protein
MLKPFFRSLPICCALLVSNAPLTAMDAEDVEDAIPAAQYSASLGSVTLDNEQLYRLAFRPDIPLGKWGVAFDIELFLNNEGEFSNRGWEYDTSAELFDTVLRKIYYVRYGRPSENLYIKIGALDGVTLGHGLIMDNYRNTLQYPGIKHTGLQFHLKDIGGMQLGLEGILNNFQDFQEGGALIGARLSAVPVSKLELGITYVVDIDQYSGLIDKTQVGADMFSMLGFDATYPIIAQEHLQLQLYGQAAFIIDDEDQLSDADAEAQGVAIGNRKAKGFGFSAPGLWLNAGPLDGRLEFRHFQDDFDSNYFDNLYDLDRARIDVASGRVTSKDALLARGETLSGVFGRLGFDLGQFIYASADYQYLSGANDPKQQVHASATLADQLLQNIPRLQQARAYFQKNNIGTRLNDKGDLGSEDGFFEPTEDTFFGYIVSMEVNSGVNLLWDTRFIYQRDANLKLERKKVMFIETQFVF